MKYEWLEKYSLSKKGAVKDYKEEWEATRYLVGGKMFALLGENKEKKPIITLKCEPETGEFLRDRYPDIIAGYYMNKRHWNSVYMDGEVPDNVLKEMIDSSYELVLKSLTQKMRNEILGS